MESNEIIRIEIIYEELPGISCFETVDAIEALMAIEIEEAHLENLRLLIGSEDLKVIAKDYTEITQNLLDLQNTLYGDSNMEPNIFFALCFYLNNNDNPFESVNDFYFAIEEHLLNSYRAS